MGVDSVLSCGDLVLRMLPQMGSESTVYMELATVGSNEDEEEEENGAQNDSGDKKVLESRIV